MNRRHGRFRPWAHGLRFAIIFAAALLICGTSERAGIAQVTVGGHVTVGGPFTLTGPDGTTVTDQTYRGKWLLVFFGYTFCPNVCPTTLNEIATALEKLGAGADKLHPLFITVDPERDTPEIMNSYTAAFDARIDGLTGSPQQIAAIAEQYGAYAAVHKADAQDDAQDYVVDHSTYIYLMDPQGKFVRGFDAETPGDRIADTVRKIMAQ